MANRPQQLELPPPRTYCRTEFTALRARVKGLPVATIARLYFDPEEHEILDVERLLRTMRDDLVSRVVTRALGRLLEQLPDLEESARRQLAGTSPHAFRRTFGTQSAAAGMAIEVLQQVLGHGSLQTTTIYVNAEQQRMRQESAKCHARLAAGRGE
uniref:site-specific integrase n=1 Tax=Burkholderia gladioli TaxID=28095 RepID=UPI0021526EED|nr:site-specific integrase [Burkholderia gladioli]